MTVAQQVQVGKRGTLMERIQERVAQDLREAQLRRLKKGVFMINERGQRKKLEHEINPGVAVDNVKRGIARMNGKVNFVKMGARFEDKKENEARAERQERDETEREGDVGQ